MLNRDEYTLCIEARTKGKEFVETELKRRKIQNYEWLGDLREVSNILRYYLEMYKLITGCEELNPNTVAHHVIDLYGPECANCEKPLRTKQAGYCAECGFGIEEYKTDRRPLIQRKPELFK